ncbi:hypothetical protein ACSX9W_12900 [Kosakonia cowanii]|uniref:hypothetical protein n=1 Tax=Kosakonia cowanii TaxID=208223 RepID=UPI003F69A9DE
MKINEMYDALRDDIDLVNSSLGIIKKYRLFYTTSVDPDYSYSNGYDGYAEKNYYFKGNWGFDYDFFKVFEVEIVNKIFVLDEIKQKINSVCPATKAAFSNINSLNSDDFINSYFASNPHKENLSEFDDCIFHMDGNNPPYISAMEIDAIDNNLSKIIYSGSYCSTGMDHGNSDEVVCELNIVGAKNHQPFYFELLIEAYALLNENNFKMSCFMSYAALESYINQKIYGQDTDERFSDKFKKAYDTVPGLTTHETFSKLNSLLSDYTLVRNTIAHGRDDDEIIYNIDADSAKEMYIYVSAVILAIENGFQKLNDIKLHIKPKKKR